MRGGRAGADYAALDAAAGGTIKGAARGGLATRRMLTIRVERSRDAIGWQFGGVDVR